MPFAPRRDRGSRSLVVTGGREPQGAGCRQVPHLRMDLGEQVEDLVILALLEGADESVSRHPRVPGLDVGVSTLDDGGHPRIVSAGCRSPPANCPP